MKETTDFAIKLTDGTDEIVQAHRCYLVEENEHLLARFVRDIGGEDGSIAVAHYNMDSVVRILRMLPPPPAGELTSLEIRKTEAFGIAALTEDNRVINVVSRAIRYGAMEGAAADVYSVASGHIYIKNCGDKCREQLGAALRLHEVFVIRHHETLAEGERADLQSKEGA